MFLIYQNYRFSIERFRKNLTFYCKIHKKLTIINLINQNKMHFTDKICIISIKCLILLTKCENLNTSEYGKKLHL